MGSEMCIRDRYDICKSEIIVGKDEVRSKMSIEDFKFSLPNDLYELLSHYGKEMVDYEYSQFIIDNKQWNSTIVLSREELDDSTQGKILRFLENEKFRIESYIHKEAI